MLLYLLVQRVGKPFANIQDAQKRLDSDLDAYCYKSMTYIAFDVYFVKSQVRCLIKKEMRGGMKLYILHLNSIISSRINFFWINGATNINFVPLSQ